MSTATEWVLELHLKSPRRPEQTGYEVVSRLRVDASGHAVIDGDRTQMPTGLRTFDPATGKQLTYETDPARWAKHLHTRLRSPYLVPVIVHDATAAAATVNRREAAQLAGVSPDHWSTDVARGRAPRPVPGIRPYRWRRDEVIEHMRHRLARSAGAGNPGQHSQPNPG